MMNNKSIIAIAIVAVIIVAGAGIYLVLGNNGSEKVDPADETTRLNICGNANLDNYLDDRDIQFIQDIIDGKETKTTLADANNDGKIDQKDIDQVNPSPHPISTAAFASIPLRTVGTLISTIRLLVSRVISTPWPSSIGLPFRHSWQLGQRILSSMPIPVHSPQPPADSMARE